VKGEPVKKRNDGTSDELRPEYDLRQLLNGGVRGKYATQYRAGTNLVLLDATFRNLSKRKRSA
jgi:hypothetical protein